MRSKILSEEFGWDKELAKKIWCFGPDTTGVFGGASLWCSFWTGCVLSTQPNAILKQPMTRDI